MARMLVALARAALPSHTWLHTPLPLPVPACAAPCVIMCGHRCPCRFVRAAPPNHTWLRTHTPARAATPNHIWLRTHTLASLSVPPHLTTCGHICTPLRCGGVALFAPPLLATLGHILRRPCLCRLVRAASSDHTWPHTPLPLPVLPRLTTCGHIAFADSSLVWPCVCQMDL